MFLLTLALMLPAVGQAPGDDLAPHRDRGELWSAIPARSDVLLFEDSRAQSAYAGYRERWVRDSLPPPPHPVAFAFQPLSAAARGPLVDVGDGGEGAFSMLDAQGIEIRGTIAVTSLGATPGGELGPDPWDRAREIAERAAAAGALGLLVALDSESFVTPRANVRGGRFPIPVLPIRPSDLDEIQGRLRVTRVRGADGKAVSLRVGPGPVEAEVAVASQ